jgi:DnaK suppressor protein
MVATAGLPDAYGIRILRAQLVERRERLLREIRTRLESSRGSPASEPGDDAPTRSEMHDLDLAEAERDAREVDAITAALGRMSQGTYGLCAQCGVPIGHARLTVNPQSLRCVACETAAEGE